MTQPTLFDLYREPLASPPPVAAKLARRTDPETSKQAAREAVASGSVAGHKRKILELLLLRPASGLELAAITVKYTQRLSDLRKDGFKIDARRTVYHASGSKIWMYYLEDADA